MEGLYGWEIRRYNKKCKKPCYIPQKIHIVVKVVVIAVVVVVMIIIIRGMLSLVPEAYTDGAGPALFPIAVPTAPKR